MLTPSSLYCLCPQAPLAAAQQAPGEPSPEVMAKVADMLGKAQELEYTGRMPEAVAMLRQGAASLLFLVVVPSHRHFGQCYHQLEQRQLLGPDTFCLPACRVVCQAWLNWRRHLHWLLRVAST